MSIAANSGNSLNAGVLTRRILFFLLLIGLSLLYLLVLFRGLDHEKGMDQAQLGREIARTNSFSSKVLRPVAVWQNGEVNNGTPNLVQAEHDTYHAPLYPLFLAAVIKTVGGDNADKWRMTEEDSVYKLDRVIAAASVICFLMAIGVNYLLICRIFDTRIGGVCALLMLLCELNWRFCQSGLPQMFMLLLFSCACFFAYRAVENTQENRPALVSAILAGAFFGLLAITHWLTIWIILGFALYAGFFIRPRGAAALAALGFVVAFSLFPLLKNVEYSGHPGGTAILSLFDGLGTGEDDVMRTYELDDATLSLKNLPFKILRISLLQTGSLYNNLGAILTAPLFFLALLHPFKRASIANFRWCLLLMWVFGSLGMSIFGVKSETSPNQLHILFAPLFTAYGLAFVAILWSRLKFTSEMPQLRHLHLVVVVVISSGPLLLDIPRQIRAGIMQGGVTRPHWPPYFPVQLNLRLAELTPEDGIVVSDQPWAVAWYADRKSLWLPKKAEVFDTLEDLALSQGTPFSGILISPSSHSSERMTSVYGEYGEFSPLVMDGWNTLIMRERPGSLASRNPKMKAILNRYPYPHPLVNTLLIYWSSQSDFDAR